MVERCSHVVVSAAPARLLSRWGQALCIITQQLSFAPGPIELCSGNKVELCSLLDFYFILIQLSFAPGPIEHDSRKEVELCSPC